MKVNRRQRGEDYKKASKQRKGTCEHCGEDFIYYSIIRTMRFCGRTCYKLAHEANPAQKLYFDQLRMARKRKIPFLFTFESWWKLWQDSGHWEERGLKRGQYVMARFGDEGPYSIDNVEIIKTEQNLAEPRKTFRGEKVNTAKLTEKEVREIRSLKGILTERELARKYDIHSTNVKRILKRETWSWLE